VKGPAVKLKDGEAARIVHYLCRVVPQGKAEQAEVEAIVKRLSLGGR
jgi:hypothetical protein